MNILFKNLQRAANDLRAAPRKPQVLSVITIAQRRRRLVSAGFMLVLTCFLITCLTVFWFINRINETGQQIVPLKSFIAQRHTPDLSLAPLAAKPANDALNDIVLPASNLAPDAPLAGDPAITIVADKLSDLPVIRNPDDHAAIDMGGNAAPPEYLLEQAKAALQADNEESALELYEQVLAADGNSHEALAGKTYILARNGDYDGAVMTGKKLLRLYPQDAAARRNLIAALGQSVAPEAGEELERLATANPRDAQLQAALAAHLVTEGDSDEALPHLDQAVRAAPGDLHYRIQLAVLYDRTDHPAEALALYTQILRAANEESVTAADVPQGLGAIKQRVMYLQAKMANNR